MALNVGYLTCDRTAKGDEVFTPFYAVQPLLEFMTDKAKKPLIMTLKQIIWGNNEKKTRRKNR